MNCDDEAFPITPDFLVRSSAALRKRPVLFRDSLGTVPVIERDGRAFAVRLADIPGPTVQRSRQHYGDRRCPSLRVKAISHMPGTLWIGSTELRAGDERKDVFAHLQLIRADLIERTSPQRLTGIRGDRPVLLRSICMQVQRSSLPPPGTFIQVLRPIRR